MRFIFLYCVLFLCFGSMNLFAQIKTENLELKGFFQADHISYFKNIEGKINSRDQILTQFDLNSSLKKSASFFTSIEARNDLADNSRNRFIMKEGYVRLNKKFMDLRVGKQIFIWGAADGINPTNNITPVDYHDFIDYEDEWIGIYAISSKFYLNNFKLELIYSPIFTPSNLALSTNSRWLADLPSNIVSPVDGSLIKAGYVIEKPRMPNEDYRSSQYAAKLSASLGNFDLSASYYNGFNDIPVFYNQITPMSLDSVSIAIKSVYRKHQVIGFDLATVAFLQIGLRAEMAYFIPEKIDYIRDAQNDPYFMSVIGVDRRFSDLLGDFRDLYFNFQWVHQILKGNKEVPNTNFDHIFQEAFVGRVEFGLSSYTNLCFQGNYDFKAKDYLFRPELNYEISEGTKLSVFCDLVGGKKDTFWGRYEKNDRVQIKLKYNF